MSKAGKQGQIEAESTCQWGKSFTRAAGAKRQQNQAPLKHAYKAIY
jgi:hypothetical protein